MYMHNCYNTLGLGTEMLFISMKHSWNVKQIFAVMTSMSQNTGENRSKVGLKIVPVQEHYNNPKIKYFPLIPDSISYTNTYINKTNN